VYPGAGECAYGRTRRSAPIECACAHACAVARPRRPSAALRTERSPV